MTIANQVTLFVPNQVTSIASSGASQNLVLPPSGNSVYDITLTSNCTFTLTNSVFGNDGQLQIVSLILRQAGSGGFSPVLPASVKWAGTGTAPTFNTSAGSINYVTLSTSDGGATIVGAAAGTGGTSGGSGSVTSVGASSSTLNVTGSPITSSGTIDVELKTLGTAGTYANVTVDAFGRVVSGSAVSAFASAVAGAGTTQGTATSITNASNVVTSGAANSGVILAITNPGTSSINISAQRVVNSSGVQIYVYPPVGAQIGSLAVNAGYALSNNASVAFIATSATQIYITV